MSKAAFDSAMVELQKELERMKDGLGYVTNIAHGLERHPGSVAECMVFHCRFARETLRGDKRYLERK